MHPTVKPASLVADAIRDSSERNDIVLDQFGGSGTTLIACEKTGRIGRLIEIDPLYCDGIVRRFERFTGLEARLADVPWLWRTTRSPKNAGWDRERLALEIPALTDLLVIEGLDIFVTGFSPVEIDQITADFEDGTRDPADSIDPN